MGCPRGYHQNRALSRPLGTGGSGRFNWGQMTADLHDYRNARSEWLSVCCGAIPLGEVVRGLAVCSKCHEFTEFEYQKEESDDAALIGEK